MQYITLNFETKILLGQSLNEDKGAQRDFLYTKFETRPCLETLRLLPLQQSTLCHIYFDFTCIERQLNFDKKITRKMRKRAESRKPLQ